MIAQLGILLFGVTAIWLSQDGRPRVARWACIFGLCSQPFWLASAWQAGQWGVFAVSMLYTLAWARGVRNHWLRRSAV